ncbi:hypothetical protein [Aneurinibacillus aneurinilyticus]|jgi:hypothetical protein|uniref:Spore coat protein n=3 Tax=Aneurinibacillus aneurinilyticus TaxID=1391 RepID=A0A848CTJ4_ANEAE|nr:hypothetical protein [Aneurinibacillus aneurinilyticus]ERI07680.1 hypothetical protein HMPREF0083_04220 [Aneurinibacillus aneurinilyticus ATCC 12856]MCI1694527.1 hypothetical protein [Aneurinibacillus aneurinilyticus]MED0705602.1 hypothetical protein [Aneurinibacillus aneurinilyticus]MED0724493.1 hypothetical protein [Aneurinibacillus aneurinilyticus]MED0731328.1 hypothetical protein [Aneurinibacillus aneurinilyticus]
MQQQMAGQAQSQQPAMMTPPTVITVKDTYYVKDQMSWLLVAMKKCSHYAQECTDPKVKQIIDRAGQMHQRHYNTLLQHCQNDNTSAMNTIPGSTSAQ